MRNKSLAKEPTKKRAKAWLWNAGITVAVVVGMMGLSRISPELAWILAAVGLVCLGVFFYLAGRSER